MSYIQLPTEYGWRNQPKQMFEILNLIYKEHYVKLWEKIFT